MNNEQQEDDNDEVAERFMKDARAALERKDVVRFYDLWSNELRRRGIPPWFFTMERRPDEALH